MKNKRKFSKALARIIWLATAFVICISAVLYQRGVFDFSFHIRNRGQSDIHPADTTPALTTTAPPNAADDTKYGDEYALQFKDALRAATNIANVGAGILQGGDAVKFEFADFATLSAEGYELTYADFDREGEMRLCLINTGIDAPYDKNAFESYEMYFYTEAKDDFHIPEGKRRIVYDMQSGVRLYMGYIIVDDGETQTIYSSFGEKLFSEYTNFLIPALTRDLDNNPLFVKNDKRYEGEYYYLNSEGELVQSDYNDETDNRGLYFDYVPTYGLSDNNIHIYDAVISVKTEITSEIPQTEPITEPITEPATDEIPAETEAPVTIYTEEITVPPAEESTDVADSTEIPPNDTNEIEYTDLPSTEDTAEPETTYDEIGTEQVTEEYPWDEEYNEDDEYSDEEYSDEVYSDDEYSPVDETLPLEEITEEYTEEITEEITEDTQAPETENTDAVTDAPSTEVIQTDAPSTGEAEEITTEAPVTTEEPVVTDPPPQYVVVDTIYTDELRFAYGYNEWYMLTGYNYKEAYSFNEHYAAVVYPDNVLLFINEYGKIDYYLYRETYYWSNNGRYAFSIYTAPVLRGIQSVGSLYFDKGYVRIRQLDTDKYYGNPDWLIGEYDYLIDDYGRKFNIPADYTLVGYSDGVLLLERDGLYGYYSIEGKWIAQPIFTFARPFAEGLGVIGFKNGVKGVIDTEGNVVIPFEYEEISQVSTGIIAAYNGEWNFFGKVTKVTE